MKKKFLLTAGTAILALGVLTACGDKADDNGSEQPGGTTPTEQPGDANDAGEDEVNPADDAGDNEEAPADADNAGDDENTPADDSEEEAAN